MKYIDLLCQGWCKACDKRLGGFGTAMVQWCGRNFIQRLFEGLIVLCQWGFSNLVFQFSSSRDETRWNIFLRVWLAIRVAPGRSTPVGASATCTESKWLDWTSGQFLTNGWKHPKSSAIRGRSSAEDVRSLESSFICGGWLIGEKGCVMATATTTMMRMRMRMRMMRTRTMMIHDRINQVYRVCYMFVLGFV